MLSFRLSNNAKDDLERLYLYGYARYGEAKADEYYSSLFSTFSRICENPHVYQSVDHLRPGYRRCPHGPDSIYYKISGSQIQIMAIIGGQDLDNFF